jgi:hypothetical protein
VLFLGHRVALRFSFFVDVFLLTYGILLVMIIIRLEGKLEEALRSYCESTSLNYTEASRSLLIESLLARGYITLPKSQNEALGGTEC